MTDSEITIVPLDHRHIAQVQKWPSRHFAANTLLKNPVESTGHTPDNFGWAAIRDDEVLAISTVKLNKEHVGYINCIVKPGRQHAGVGTKIFEYTLDQPQVMELIHLHAAIDPGNTAARQVLREHGFTMIGNDHQGYLEYAKHKHY